MKSSKKLLLLLLLLLLCVTVFSACGSAGMQGEPGASGIDYPLPLKKVSEISLIGNPKNAYHYLSQLDLSEFKLAVRYIDNSEDTVNVTRSMVNGYDHNFLGTRRVVISYGEKSIGFNVTAVDATWTIIETEQEFLNISSNGNYILARNLDFENSIVAPIPDFSGSLDGNCNTISNVNITSVVGQSSGLFLRLTDAAIMQLGIADFVINVTNTNFITVGLLASRATNSIISNCFATGHINASSTSYGVNAGGFVGSITTTNISNCISNVNIIAYDGRGHTGLNGTCLAGIAANLWTNSSITATVAFGNLKTNGGWITGNNYSASNFYYENILLDAGDGVVNRYVDNEITHTQMTAQGFYLSLGFSDFIWDFSHIKTHLPSFRNSSFKSELPM